MIILYQIIAWGLTVMILTILLWLIMIPKLENESAWWKVFIIIMIFNQIFAWRPTPPLFRYRITILVQCWLSLEKKNKIEVSKWDKKNLALKIHNLMKNQDTPSSLQPSSHSLAWEVCPSLSWPASPLPLWPSLSGSENWRRWPYDRQNISSLRVYGSNLPINIAPCIIVKTIAWKI